MQIKITFLSSISSTCLNVWRCVATSFFWLYGLLVCYYAFAVVVMVKNKKINECGNTAHSSKFKFQNPLCECEWFLICIKLQRITIMSKFLGPNLQLRGRVIPIEQLFQEPSKCVCKNVTNFKCFVVKLLGDLFVNNYQRLSYCCD